MTQFSFWRDALAGKVIDTEKGSPRSGYYRSQTGDEVIAIWRDADGSLQCERQKFGGGANMHPDEIDELFGFVCRYPIPFELYEAVRDRGEALPLEYRTRLTLKEIQAGIAWTPDLGRAKLGPQIDEAADNPRAVAGDNNPPEELPPDRALAKRIHDLGLQLKTWLDKIGAKPNTQAEAEILAGYANKFKDFENEATAAHKAEKAPHLDKCREIDAKWFVPVRDKAVASRDKIVAMIRVFERAEDERRAEAARLANEAARKAAEQSSIEAPPETVSEVAPEPAKVTTLRGTGKRATEKLVTDLPAFLAFCAGMGTPPPDLIEVAEKIARKFKAAGVAAPGMKDKAA